MLLTPMSRGQILLSIMVGLVCGYDCAISPVVLQNQNGTLYDGVAINRGINFQCSPSGQKISLRPSFIWNNTRVRNSVNCQGNLSQIYACQGASGSTFIYDPDFHPELLTN